MNTRSLRFRLSVWYAGWLGTVFVLASAFIYIGVRNYLERNLSDLLERRAERLTVLFQRSNGDWETLASDVRNLFAPEGNGRFVRVMVGGRQVYLSGPPLDGSFDPETVAAAGIGTNSKRRKLPDGSVVFVASLTGDFRGQPVLFEFGSSTESIEATLHEFFTVLAIGLMLLLPIAVIGGYLLVKRALGPVDRIIASAERISAHNLSERLPVPQTRDELERISTALNGMIRRLEDSFSHTKRFLADASHELRTPLTIVRAEIEAILERAADPEITSRAGSALEEADRLKTIVEALFALARLEAGEAQKESVHVDLAELVMTTADQMALLAQDKGVRIACHTPHHVIVNGDRARLKQVAVNLLDNAIKYTPRGGQVDVHVTTRDSVAILEVADNGIGIPSDALPHVFERFYRADKARSREQGGAGLGLSIVEAICHAHNGRVEAHSKEGEGARLVVELPLVTASQTS